MIQDERGDLIVRSVGHPDDSGQWIIPSDQFLITYLVFWSPPEFFTESYCTCYNKTQRRSSCIFVYMFVFFNTMIETSLEITVMLISSGTPYWPTLGVLDLVFVSLCSAVFPWQSFKKKFLLIPSNITHVFWKLSIILG